MGKDSWFLPWKEVFEIESFGGRQTSVDLIH